MAKEMENRKIYTTTEGLKLIFNAPRTKNDRAGDYVFIPVGVVGSTVFIEPQDLEAELGAQAAKEIRNELENISWNKYRGEWE